MKKIILLFLLFFSIAKFSFAFSKMEGGDCKSCHKITKEEATKILNQLDPNIKVEKIGYSEVSGVFELFVKDNKSKMGIVYLDFSKKYLIIGNVIDIAGKKSLTESALEEQRQIDVSKISVKDALIMGNKNGTKKVYVFSDPECPYCFKLHQELEKLIKEDKQLLVYIILFGLDIHPNAQWKSESIICKSKENMEEAIKMLENSYEGKEIQKINCGKNYADSNKKQANSFGISGTPAIVLPNGKVISGYRTKDDLKKMLNSK
ncbi:MAG: DsbC family protein [Proteobacteria bacterium]|nr:DsbC family protein [Pseudomonadota bacterium]